ncbi:MAG: hypothetical protein ACI8TX_002357 [Hyphomicrobiaceae bacterium]|jgi:hypothetical protein
MKVSLDLPGIARLQELLNRSSETATPAVAQSVAWRPRQMSAEDLVDFWSQAKVAAMTTVGPKGQPHTAPVHARLLGDHLYLVIYGNTVRRRDLRTNPRVSFCTWGDRGEAVLLYGRAREVQGSLRPARETQAGEPRDVVELDVELTRVYAMAGRPSED